MRSWLKFKETWLDKRIDYDGTYGYQCVDLAKLYLEWLGFWKVWALGNAKQVPQSKLFNTGREKIVGTNNVMQGDIIIRTQGKYGHIAIVDRIVWGFVYVLEQNGSGKNSGSGIWDNAIRIHAYPLKWYDMVLRCSKIIENLELEKTYIKEKIAERQAYLNNHPEDPTARASLEATVDYGNCIEYLKKK